LLLVVRPGLLQLRFGALARFLRVPDVFLNVVQLVSFCLKSTKRRRQRRKLRPMAAVATKAGHLRGVSPPSAS